MLKKSPYEIIKKLDKLHRITLPKSFCEALGAKSGTSLLLELKEDTITIRKAYLGCVFCGKEEDLSEFGGKVICADCREKLHTR